MKIVFNKEIESFLKRCAENTSNDFYNDFLDLDLRDEGVENVTVALHQNGYPEFNKPQEEWPSLYLSTQQFEASSFHKNIKFDGIKEEDVSLEWLEFSAHRLFSLKEIQSDPNRELNDWMVLRALDENLKTLSLSINNDVWMLDVPSEAATIDPCAQKAFGHVVSFGLGIGYFVFMALKNPLVKSITVIENNERIIELFKKYILPQFASSIPLEIIHGDAYNYFKEDQLKHFDYIFVDIYQSNEDGLETEMALLEQFNPTFEALDFWIEDSILEILPALIFVWIITHDQKISHPYPVYEKILFKIDDLFKKDNRVIKSVKDLKELMYDRLLHRAILAHAIESNFR